MGASRDEFVKYPRTPHLFGSKGTDDDKHLNEAESNLFIADESLIVEEKIDGTNVGIHFTSDGKMVLQCRGHLITQGMHPQYDLFKQWTAVKRFGIEERLEDRFILFGEWLYARHSVHYRQLPHYFFEFDIYGKDQEAFLNLEQRLALIDGTGIETVPVLHRGAIGKKELAELIGPSRFGSEFENPMTGRTDNLMEGLYLRVEADGVVAGRAKFVRSEFVEKVKQSEHWQHQAMVPNVLKEGADTWLATHRGDLPVISLDAMREELDIEPTGNQGAVAQLARERCREMLRARTSFAFNATNLLRQTRQRWIDLFSDYNARIEMVYVEPALSVILDQNKRRKRIVPEDVIVGLANRLEPPTWTETHGLVVSDGSGHGTNTK